MIASYVPTITPAEVGGLWAPANPEHAKLGWSYDFEQTERIARAAYDSTGYDATMEVVEFVMAEADRRHATALAAKDAELAAVKASRDGYAKDAAARATENDRLRAQLAEANKALERHRSERSYVVGWNDGFAHVASEDLKFPTMLRKMWSGGEVQAWLDEQFAARRALSGGQEDG